MNREKARKIERLLVVCVLAALAASIVINSRLAGPRSSSTLRALDTGWYRMVDGVRQEVTLPAKLTVPEGEDLVLYYDDLLTSDGRRSIFTRGAVYNLQMKVGIHIIYDYEDRGFQRNYQMKSKLDCMAILPENPSRSQLTMTYHNTGSNEFDIKPVYVSRSGEALQKLWLDNIYQTICIFTMSVIGVICICGHIYLKIQHIDDSRMGSAAWFLLLCGSWALLDSSLAQQIQGGTLRICLLATFAFMAMPIPVIHFVRSTGQMQKYHSLNWLLFLAYGNILGQATCHILLGIQYSDMLIVTHLVHTLLCTTVYLVLYKEYRENRDFEITAVLQGLTILNVAAIPELIFYWVIKSPYYGLILETAVLVFIIRMLFAILSSMASNIRFKAEAMAYRNMSREDRLTGLANRRAFDEAMNELELHACRNQNAALFFVDVNGLKRINDRHGHLAGDELIISTARCLSSAFAACGTCYRIGGDEFAVLVVNPKADAEYFSQRIHEAILYQNGRSHWPLSLAWGVSYQRDEAGSIKRSSDWLYEADQAMYKMKMAMKADPKEGLEAFT